MPLLDTVPPSGWTARQYNPAARHAFAFKYPEYADTARVLLALRPDFRRLKFRCATIGMARHDKISRVQIDLESRERSVIVWVWPTAAGLIADVVVDRKWEAWEKPARG